MASELRDRGTPGAASDPRRQSGPETGRLRLVTTGPPQKGGTLSTQKLSKGWSEGILFDQTQRTWEGWGSTPALSEGLPPRILSTRRSDLLPSVEGGDDDPSDVHRFFSPPCPTYQSTRVTDKNPTLLQYVAPTPPHPTRTRGRSQWSESSRTSRKPTSFCVSTD